MKTNERDPRQIAPKTTSSIEHFTLGQAIRQQRERANFAAQVAKHGIVEVRPGDLKLMDQLGERGFLELARKRPISDERERSSSSTESRS